MPWRHRRSLNCSNNIIFKHFKNTAGCDHSLFQNNKGKIFASGYNMSGMWIGS